MKSLKALTVGLISFGLLYGSSAFGAISLVQVVSSTVAGVSATGVTTTITTAGGNTLVVMCGMYNDRSFISATDGTNTYTRDAFTSSSLTNNIAIFHSSNVSAGTYSIRCNGSGASAGGWNGFVHEYSGLNNAFPVDASSSSTGSSVLPNPGAITTTASDTVVVATGAYNIAPSGIHLAPGYVLEGNGMGNFQPGLSYDKIFSQATTTNATSSNDSSGVWAVGSVAYRMASSSVATSNRRIRGIGITR